MAAKTWKFTDFDMRRDFWERLDVNVIAFGEEVCPSTGKAHIQGHVTFKRTYRLAALKKLHETAHWSKALCTDFNYELKGENVFVKDNRKQGERSDLKRAAAMMLDKKKVATIARECPETWVRYGKGLLHLASAVIEPRDGSIAPTVTVYYGRTGTGKSRKAREDLSLLGDRWVWTPARGQWFDGYVGQENVIFDEFRGQLPLGMLLTLLDRYDCPVQYKGGTVEFNTLNIIITSPCHPRFWYEKLEHEDTWEQLKRRLTFIHCLETETEVADR